MFPKDEIKTYVIGDKIKAYILESGSLKELRKDHVRLNTFIGNNLEPTINNIYIKVKENGKYYYTRLIGTESPSSFVVDQNRIIYHGSFMGIYYSIFFHIYENAFYYTINIMKNSQFKEVTIYYGMDVSIADVNAVNNNEAYVSQYIDHKAFLNDNGYTICSRQNQGQHYYLEMGSLTKNVAYTVDGFQFFGKEYKKTNFPQAILEPKLVSEIYQYEFAYVALQSETLDLSIDRTFVFYGIYSDEHNEEITKPLYNQYVLNNYQQPDIHSKVHMYNRLDLKIHFNNIYNAPNLTNEELDLIYPSKKQSEYINDSLVSFFTPDKAHVILPIKELLMERPSGNILISQPTFENSFAFEQVLATTCYIYGVFNSQIVYGNTSFNKLMSNQRNPLNCQKINGQRIFIKIDNSFQLLGLPSLFVMGLNYCKWFYKVNNDIVAITTTISLHEPKIVLSFQSLRNIKYETIITNHITMGQTENENKVTIINHGNEIDCLFDIGSMTHQKYPERSFKIKVSKTYRYNDDRVFYQDGFSHNENMLTLAINDSEFKLLIIGIEEKSESNFFDEIIEQTVYLNKMTSLVNYFNIKQGDNLEIESFNYLIYWYTHNALVHYLSPHGLEQYNGAAWGTRDVCQGPAELFFALNNYQEVRTILLNVYKHQFYEDGNFPQWFMFDRFSYIQDSGSHGDIVVWPARLLANYLIKTNDLTILDEKLPFTQKGRGQYTNEQYSLLDHLDKELNNIETNFIKNTYLSCYGGGDWDDTLQPAHQEYKENMSSGWTVSLTYEMYNLLGRVFKLIDKNKANHYLNMAKHIKADYQKYIIKDKIPMGFIHFTDTNVQAIIHPSDHITNIQYRLLPFTRAIISEIFDNEQTIMANQIIDNNLKFPDGVRLMNKTVTYNGGVNKYFNRAETSANFGREIGLQYCHAHIRYCEAMHKIGNAQDLYQGLQKINPLIITSIVPNALPRQRNSYFSSSDGNFLNRYEAMQNFDKLRTGEVNVKSGWRIYSSGSGIYLSTLITKMLGIDLMNDEIIIDPIIPKELNGLELTYKLMNKLLHITYYVTNQRKVIVNKKELSYKETNNLYRKGGYRILLSDLNEENEIEIYL